MKITIKINRDANDIDYAFDTFDNKTAAQLAIIDIIDAKLTSTVYSNFNKCFTDLIFNGKVGLTNGGYINVTF